MGVMKNAMKNRFVQAALRGVKPCMIGVILATGAYMMMKNLLVPDMGAAIDVQALLITALLLSAMPAYQRIRKKKLSPVLLIVISAVLGVIFY